MEEVLLALLSALLSFLGAGECAVAVIASPGECSWERSPLPGSAPSTASLRSPGRWSLRLWAPWRYWGQKVSAGRTSFVLSAPCIGVEGGPLLKILYRQPATRYALPVSVERVEVVDL